MTNRQSLCTVDDKAKTEKEIGTLTKYVKLTAYWDFLCPKFSSTREKITIFSLFKPLLFRFLLLAVGCNS